MLHPHACLHPLLVVRPERAGPHPGEELEDLVYDDDREGDDQDSLPLGPGEGADREHLVQEGHVENGAVKDHGEGDGTKEVLVDPGAHDQQTLVLGEAVEGVKHLNGHQDGQGDGGGGPGGDTGEHAAVDGVLLCAVVEVALWVSRKQSDSVKIKMKK